MKTVILRTSAAALVAACLVAPALSLRAQSTGAAPPLFAEDADAEFAPATLAFEQRLVGKPTIKRTRVALMDARALDGDALTLNVFPEVSFEADQTDIGFTGARHRTWLGTLRNGQGTVALVINGNRLNGKITSTRGSFEIFPLEDGGCAIAELDNAAFPACGGADESPGSAQPAPPEGAATGDPTGDDPTADTPSGNRVRVLVAYTAGAQANTATDFNRTMLEHIELAVVESNQGYANSGVFQRMELAYLYEVNYNELGSDLVTDRNRFQGTSDGFMDEVHGLRNIYDADMCALIQDGSSTLCGRAFGFDYTSAANMFQVTEYQCATGNFSFAHEFGHTQGCRHDTDTTLTPFAYGHGFRQGNTTWRTIMAVTTGNSATRLNYWSNPAITSPVSPFVAMGTPINGANLARDNESALDVGDNTVINHRTTPATFTLNDTIAADEFADMITTDSLTAQNFVAQSGSTATLRAPNKVTLLPGFHARAGSHVRVFRGTTSGTVLSDADADEPPAAQ